MENQYAYAAHMAELCNLLEDQWSKDIFWARLQFDCQPNLENEIRLLELSGSNTEKEIQFRKNFQTFSKQLQEQGKKLFLYGASANGRKLGSMLLEKGDFFAYCARNHEKYTSGVLGKQVYPPEYVFQHSDECCVLIASAVGLEEIYGILMEHHFPQEQIFLPISFVANRELLDRQYFDFPGSFRKGTAFVDAGCFDCGTSKRFSEWCGGEYSKIFAFEPDPINAQRCRGIADSSNLRLELIPFVLSSRPGEVEFSANTSGLSHIVFFDTPGHGAMNMQIPEKRVMKVKTTTLDQVVQDTEIGFIKMDIEGSELDALHGAEQTILRDKPHLAICVYHRCGDVLAIMDYLHQLVPQYHFWLRHYLWLGLETVLYASIGQT